MKDKKKETEEKPKAVVEMEENSDVGKAKKRIKEKKEQDVKSANKKFIIEYIIFIIIFGLITGGLIYFSIKQLNTKNEGTTTETKIEETDIDKPIAQDSKYAINSYAETYNENSLTIKYYAGNDQLVENTYGGEEYAQIEGLLDKDIQNNINKRLKETAKKLKEGNRRTFTQVTANYGNILSAVIYSYNLPKYNAESASPKVTVFVNALSGVLMVKVVVSETPVVLFMVS